MKKKTENDVVISEDKIRSAVAALSENRIMDFCNVIDDDIVTNKIGIEEDKMVALCNENVNYAYLFVVNKNTPESIIAHIFNKYGEDQKVLNLLASFGVQNGNVPGDIVNKLPK